MTFYCFATNPFSDVCNVTEVDFVKCSTAVLRVLADNAWWPDRWKLKLEVAAAQQGNTGLDYSHNMEVWGEVICQFFFGWFVI